ncbi:MAG: metallophosphoesterase family protein [Candidatus Micrarchaeota archaeon]
MKIAIFSDTHLGYARFEKDSLDQAERVVESANKTADLIIHAGDVFDIKNPKLETIDRAIHIFKKADKKIITIHGNHERRAKDMVNPAQILHSASVLHYIHNSCEIIELNGEKLQLFGLGNVPDEYADLALRKALENFIPMPDAFKILIIHQSIKELLVNSEHELSLDYLESLPFDLIVNGHIHQKIIKLNGRFIIPGSTVITQLKKEETAPRGYILYDTKTKTHDFVEVECRKFVMEELVFDQASAIDILNAVEKRISEIRSTDENCIIRFKVQGTTKETNQSVSLNEISNESTYIDNELNSSGLAEKMKQIRQIKDDKLSVRELAVSQIEEKTKDKVSLFNSRDIFDKLLCEQEDVLTYLKEMRDKSEAIPKSAN